MTSSVWGEGVEVKIAKYLESIYKGVLPSGGFVN